MSLLLALLMSAPVAASDPAAFSSSLQACEPATFAHPHPLMRGFTTEHAIQGANDGVCGYSQSMPGGMRMECRFSDAGSAAFAQEFEAMAAGRLQGSSGDAKAWQRDCEIVMPDGKRTPMGG